MSNSSSSDTINFLRKPARKKALAFNETFWGYIFLLPIIIGFIFFTVFPVIISLYYSFTDYDGITKPTFTGLTNYTTLFQEKDFKNSLFNSLYFTLGTVPIGAFLSLSIAVLLNCKIKFMKVYRSAFFIPVIVSLVSTAMVWQWMYSTDYGIINGVLGKLGLYQPAWLSSKQWAMPSVIIMSVWKNLGFNVVIFLAGVQGISISLYEAAEIDGANIFQKFAHITIPLIKPTMVFVLIMSMIGALQTFDQIYIMTNGGPNNATQVIAHLIYMNAFQFFKQGYASAMAYVLFIIMFIASIFQLRLSEKNN